MNTPNVGAGRLERRVRRVGRETMPGILGFSLCLCNPFGAISGGAPLLRLTALLLWGFGCLTYRCCQHCAFNLDA